MVPVEMEWVDGSFVTSKWHAGDIDVVSFVGAEDVRALDAAASGRLAQLATGLYPRIVYGCHTFVSVIYPETQVTAHQRHLYERGYWDRWWGLDKLNPGNTKGYIEVRETQ